MDRLVIRSLQVPVIAGRQFADDRPVGSEVAPQVIAKKIILRHQI